jgi:MFS family permease
MLVGKRVLVLVFDFEEFSEEVLHGHSPRPLGRWLGKWIITYGGSEGAEGGGARDRNYSRFCMAPARYRFSPIFNIKSCIILFVLAWVGSLALALPMTLSPLAARLITRYGARPMSMTGAIIAALGLFLTSFVNSITLMYITFSLIYGFGTSLPYTACYDIVPKYFKKRLALATGVMISGTGATVFIMSPINETLITHVGWRKAFYAFAGFSLMAGICCLSFSPDVEKDVTPQSGGRTVLLQRRVQSTPLYRNGRYLLCCAYSFIFQLGNTIPLIHLVSI